MLEGPESINPEDAVKEVATAFTVQAQLDAGTHFVLQSYLPRDAAIGEYNALTDKLFSVIERRQWKNQLVDLKTQLAADEKNYEHFAEDFHGIEGRHAEEWQNRGKKGDPIIGAKERAAKHNAEQNLKRAKEETERKKTLIAALETKLKDG